LPDGKGNLIRRQIQFSRIIILLYRSEELVVDVFKLCHTWIRIKNDFILLPYIKTCLNVLSKALRKISFEQSSCVSRIRLSVFQDNP